MKLNLLTLSTIVFLAVLSACNNSPSQAKEEGKVNPVAESASAATNGDTGPQSSAVTSTSDAVSKTYPGFNTDNIKSQYFKIDNSKQIQLTGKSGTIYIIPKRCFTNANGTAVEKGIDIEIKEAIHPLDIVMGGLYTVSNGQTLESGGMVFVDAKSEGQQLSIAPNQSIKVQVPSKQTKDDMSYFQSEKVDGMLNWIHPVPLNPSASETDEFIDPQDIELSIIEPVITVINPKPNVAEISNENELPLENIIAPIAGRKNLEKGNVNLSFASIDDVTDKDEDEFTKYIVEHPELWDTKDFVVYKNNRYSVKAIPIAAPVQAFPFREPVIHNPDAANIINYHVPGKSLSYIFQMNQLGWANIDRISKAQPVKMVTKVKNKDKFDNIYVSIVIPMLKIFIPGYFSKKNFYRFSHGDYEEQRFKVGSTAIIIATCEKDGKTYMDYKKFKIEKDNTIELDLQASDKETMASTLKKELGN